MQKLRDHPIRQKITVVIMLIAGVVLLLAFAALFCFQAYTLKQHSAHELTVVGEITAHNCAAAVMFRDEDAASQILGGLKTMPQIVSARLESMDQQRLAFFGAERDEGEIKAARLGSGLRMNGNRMLLAKPVMLDGKREGTLYLLADLQALTSQLLKLYGGIFGLVLAASLLLAFLLSSQFLRFITDPILGLAGTARTIADHNDYSVRATRVCGDEVGVLTDAFNQMLDQIQSQDSALQGAQRELQKQVDALQREIREREQAEEALRISQQKLLESSRLAGMAEVATGVLHNVGNVLNSVNVSAGLVVEKLRRSKAPKLAKAAALLTARNGDVGEYLTKDPNGQKLPGYLAKLGEYFIAENAELLDEVDQLGRNIEHIKEVVAMQQSYAKVSGVFENLAAHCLVEDAIAMNTGAFERHGIKVDRQFSPVPLVRVDRHKVLQILINLLRNAKYALDEVKRTDKHITISILAVNDERVHIVVADNGIGISSENLTRVFAHGFTTREEGHGFGLHSGALAARAMGGSLSVASAGSGEGATFTLELPIACPIPNT
ncbi:MAG: HAMP domain-containing protein [Chthoniobacterales bacterium]|nr:HAMP domain-containing protein [Chthoniobacterales bacterium]